MDEKTGQPKIIFILGIMPRSGTHFLANLLCQHPDCSKSIVPEDGFVAGADFLTMYVNRIFELWSSDGNLPKIPHLSPKAMMLESLGDGLLEFLRNARQSYWQKKAERFDAAKIETPKRLVTKSPQVINVDKFFKLFPKEQLLIIVRDGRELVESIHKSFGRDREQAIRDWAKSARKVLDFAQKEAQRKDRFLIVKYEELHTETEKEIRKILDFLKLDASVYDFERALNLPVVGSSTFKRGEGGVHWLPVKKNEDFNPLARSANWTRARHERFNHLAKNELLQLGYEPRQFSGKDLYWKIWNRYRDLLWEAGIWRRRIGRIPRFLKKRYKIYFSK